MKISKILFLALLCFVPMMAFAQGEVKWSHSVVDNGSGNYTVQFKADIAEGWHIYDSKYQFNPTTLEFNVGKGVALEGDLREMTTAKVHFDDLYNMNIGEYEKESIFEQDFKVEGKGGEVKATISYQACNLGSCLSPTSEEVVVTLGESVATPAEVKAVKDAAGNGSLWSLIIEAILWGFAALLTPCVFPMVPMTVSFFMKSSGSAARGRINASLYGLFIVLLYTLPIALLIVITRVVGVMRLLPTSSTGLQHTGCQISSSL